MADLLREMVNFLHLSSLCQCLALIYVGQLKMESSVPKLNWGEKYSMRKDLFCGICFQKHYGFTQTVSVCLPACLSPQHRAILSALPRWRNERLQLIEVSCRYC